MAKKLWGGRFKKKIDKDFEEFSKSVQYDYKLGKYDITHSMLHAMALEKSGILNSKEFAKIITALEEIEKEKELKTYSNDSEDIHTEIQNRLEKKIGKLALKLHALRSRNDQVVFDEKLFCIENSKKILETLKDLTTTLLCCGGLHKNYKFVGYTHTQRAQVILFVDYVRAFCHMFLRDSEKIENFKNSCIAVIGSGALTGSSLTRQVYNEAIKELLSKSDLKEVSIESTKSAVDNVSDRDFIVEFLSILSIIQMHLSRLAEDLILYSTKEFSFVELPEEFCTGSSLMPHKKNPDFLELVRGYTGRIYGNLMSVLVMMKGLPLSYNRDMQLDKEPLFSSIEIVADELKIMVKFIAKLKLNKVAIEKALEDESLYATELAEYLVMEKKVPFRDAHDIVGKLIRYSEDKNIKIKSMSDEELSRFHQSLNKKVITKVMNPAYAISSKKSISRKAPKIKNA